MNGIHPQWQITEKMSKATYVREPNLVSRDDSSVSLGLGPNTTISAVEKSFHPEEYIYVSFLSFSLPDLQYNAYHFPYCRLNLRKEINGIHSISPHAKNGPSQLWHVVERTYLVSYSFYLMNYKRY